jgi:hypothetical protein
VFIDGEYEKYGELYIAPNKQPTIAGLEIITKMLMVTGLPGRAKMADPSQDSSHFAEPTKSTTPKGPEQGNVNNISVIAGTEAQIY